MLALLILSCGSNESSTTTVNAHSQIAPVIVIGGGASGLSTGVRLLELGIEPLILEKEAQLGGAGIHAGRFFGVDTKWQREVNIIDSFETASDEWHDFTGATVDINIEHFLTQSAVTLEWIESFGVEFDSVQKDIGAGSLPRIHSLSPTSPHPLTIFSELLQPYSQTNQAVSGIEYANGIFTVHTDTESYQSEHLVVASGGFARNIDLVSEYVPNINNHDWHMEAWPGMIGSSIDWMKVLHIPLQNMQHAGLYAHGVTDSILDYPEVMIIPALERSLIINQDGERVFNEQYTQSLKGGQLMLEQERLYAIFDAPLWSGTTFQGLGYNYETPIILDGVEYQRDSDLVYAANDMRDLAISLNMDVATMTATISEYNDGIQNNNDTFGKVVPNLTGIQMTPFYAVELKLSTGKSFGGAQTNQEGMTEFSNLYSVGEAAGFLGSSSSGWGFSGSITACYHLGKQAAEDIASHYSR